MNVLFFSFSLLPLTLLNRIVPEAEWAMPAEELNRLEKIYDRFAPDDPLERVAWLFVSPVSLPNPSRDGWESEERDIDRALEGFEAALAGRMTCPWR